MYKISEIEKTYPNWYDKNHSLSKEDQQWIWENMALPQEDEQRLRELQTNNVIVNGSVNGGRKFRVNSDEKLTKLQANVELNGTNSKTPAKEIAFYLETLFGHWEEKPDHWLYIAQHYTPKTIISVRSQMVKAFLRGDVSIKNPGAYFTSVIKHRPTRKNFTKRFSEKKYGDLSKK